MIPFYIFALAIFYLLLSTALYTSLKTLNLLFAPADKAALGWTILRWALLVTTAYLCLVVVARLYSPELYRVLTYYLGIVSFAFFVALPYWVYRFACQLTKTRALHHAALGWLYLGLVAAISLVSVYNFHKPNAVERYTLYSDKLSRAYRVLHLSDMQLGTTSPAEMNKKLRQAYALEPDIIVFTGDLIDFEGYERSDFDVLAESPVPIFFERGNHEFYHDPTRLLAYLQTIGPIKLLLNDRAEYGELEIFGVDFSREPGHLARVLDSLPRDREMFSILLYHEPRDVEQAVQRDFDLLLFGHTHAGQIWPFTWVVDWMYQYADGAHEVSDSFIYTSDGISLWGPRMRFGSQNEMVLFSLLPAKE